MSVSFASPGSTISPATLAGKEDSSVITANGLGIVVHGGTAGTVRPTGFARILWIGTVTPTNATDNDLWIDTT